MGMAYLMGQLGLARSPELAIPLLHRAATLASIEVPQPAYVYGLLLLNEFNQVAVPPHLFNPLIPPNSSLALEARKHIERSAYLHFAPAQYKLGHAYEFALPPFPFDALLSVQYYSLASQQGEVEADMALSKWFLCGADGSFEKDEGLAFTFAEKAARKGLSTAQFAMGYYLEVGVGGPMDIEGAKKWYRKVRSISSCRIISCCFLRLYHGIPHRLSVKGTQTPKNVLEHLIKQLLKRSPDKSMIRSRTTSSCVNVHKQSSVRKLQVTAMDLLQCHRM